MDMATIHLYLLRNNTFLDNKMHENVRFIKFTFSHRALIKIAIEKEMNSQELELTGKNGDD
jgi:hypothetical protein